MSIIALARENRKNATEAESLMWELLRGSFWQYRFRRQHPIAGYIADFACVRKRLIIEVDGGYHSEEEQLRHDQIRTEALNGKGYIVLRFSNEEIIGDTEKVKQTIKNYLIKELI